MIDELDDAPRIAAEDAIRTARDTRCVPGVSGKDEPKGGPSGARSTEKPRRSAVRGEWAIQDSNLGPLPYQRSALTD